MTASRVKGEAPRFGIGEWFGRSFVKMTPDERREFADLALGPAGKRPCPFRSARGEEPCRKKGGVCTLRLYTPVGDGAAVPLGGAQGDLRAVCPHRFEQDGVVCRTVGEVVLGTPTPRMVTEVRFLQRGRSEGEGGDRSGEPGGGESVGTGKEDVGNIDVVLVHPTATPMRWCAMEVQAVYFSGRKMDGLFRHIKECRVEGIPFPEAVRRPDYRSSGPKRLMPQLQIKVPTLRRWGKKMAVVVDAAFYRSLGEMQTVSDLTNADIAWFAVGYDESTDPVRITLGEPRKQTLERAVEGLTGGLPVTLSEFEEKIHEKLSSLDGRRPG
jgi:hypothetical protein